MRKRIVLAIGGNALIKPGQEGTAEEQIENAKHFFNGVKDLLKHNEVVITHGNGRQVGDILLQQKIGTPMPLHVCVAESQAEIGFFLEKALSDLGFDSVVIITRVEVDPNDKAFQNPSKPVGPFYEEEKPGTKFFPGKGFRKVVPSPKPLAIKELDEIKELLDETIVICCGGGGIPVSENKPLNAVIDKDLCSALLAKELNADELIILTDVNGVYKNLGEENQELISEMSVSEAKKLLLELQEGSMRPKVLAAINFNKRTLITSITGGGGTWIT